MACLEVHEMKRRILLVDDDMAVLLTLKAVLEMHQFEVQTAGSAAAALQKLRSGAYELVITDTRMETDDAGFHVLSAAREQAYNPATALLTAYPPSDDEQDWKHTGSLSILVKPIGTEDLVRQIEALLINHEDHKRLPRVHPSPEKHTLSENRQSNRKVS